MGSDDALASRVEEIAVKVLIIVGCAAPFVGVVLTIIERFR